MNNAWDKVSLSGIEPMEVQAIGVDSSIKDETIQDMRTMKIPGPTGIITEMLKISGRSGNDQVTHIDNPVIQEGVIPNDWCRSIIVSSYKVMS